MIVVVREEMIEMVESEKEHQMKSNSAHTLYILNVH